MACKSNTDYSITSDQYNKDNIKIKCEIAKKITNELNKIKISIKKIAKNKPLIVKNYNTISLEEEFYTRHVKDLNIADYNSSFPVKAINEKFLIIIINDKVRMNYTYCNFKLIFQGKENKIHFKFHAKADNNLINELYYINRINSSIAQTTIFTSINFKYSIVDNNYSEKTKIEFISYNTNDNNNTNFYEEMLKKNIKYKQMLNNNNYKILNDIGIINYPIEIKSYLHNLAYEKFSQFIEKIVNLSSKSDYIVIENNEIFLNNNINHYNVVEYMRNKLKKYINDLILSGECSYNKIKSTTLYLMINAGNCNILESIKIVK